MFYSVEEEGLLSHIYIRGYAGLNPLFQKNISAVIVYYVTRLKATTLLYSIMSH